MQSASGTTASGNVTADAGGPCVRDVCFSGERVGLLLADGRLFWQALGRHPRLAEADDIARAGWTLSDEGAVVGWPALASNGVSIDACDWVWEECCEHALAALKGQAWALDALPTRTQQVVALWRLEADGYNGGFLQFFCNWGDANCRIALDALAAIGAKTTHAVVSKQRLLLDRLEDHPEVTSYDDIPRLLTQDEREEIGNVLDPMFWGAAQEIPRRAVRYYDGPLADP